MIALPDVELSDKERNALLQLKQNIGEKFSGAEVILYGSKARGDSVTDSDIDVLVLLYEEVDDRKREEVFHLGFKVELEFDVVFGILVQSKDFWESPVAYTMPIHTNIEREGVVVL